MKTTKEDFSKFKQYASEWQKKLGLLGWDVYYAHEKKVGFYAETLWNLSDMLATITLNQSWEKWRPKNDDELNKLALHEVLHLLTAPLCCYAESRYITQEAIDASEHDMVRRLEKVIL